MYCFTLRQLAQIEAIAATGGIAQAARRLNLSPPALASALASLEQATGFELFERFPAKGLAPTPAGREFLREARRLLRQADDLNRLAGLLASDREGRIRFGCYPSLAYVFAPVLLEQFRGQAPAIAVDVAEGSSAALGDMLAENAIDIALAYGAGLAQGQMHVRHLMDVKPRVLLAASHPLARRRSLSLDDLDGLAFVQAIEEGPGPTYLEMLNRAGLFPEIALSTRSYELIRSCVGKGMGFSLMAFQPPNPVSYHGDAVSAVPLDDDIGTLPVVLAMARPPAAGSMLERFALLCEAHVRAQ